MCGCNYKRTASVMSRSCSIHGIERCVRVCVHKMVKVWLLKDSPQSNTLEVVTNIYYYTSERVYGQVLHECVDISPQPKARENTTQECNTWPYYLPPV